MVRLLSLPFTLALALSTAACDRQSAPPAQPQDSPANENGASEKVGGETAVALSGTIDRSHAGAPLPPVSVTGPGGVKLNLGSLKEPVLVNLWATWCAPCVVEMPMLNTLARQPDTPLVLAVSEDLQGAEAVNPFLAKHAFDHLQIWLDPENDLASHYGGASGGVLPTTVLYDADGKEVWRMIGAFDWSSEEAKTLVAEARAS